MALVALVPAMSIPGMSWPAPPAPAAIPDPFITVAIQAMAPIITMWGSAATSAAVRVFAREARARAAAANHTPPAEKTTICGPAGRSMPQGQAIAVIANPMTAWRVCSTRLAGVRPGAAVDHSA